MPAPDPRTIRKKDYYTDKVLPKWDLIAGWARNGLAKSQIARNLGIGVSTFERFVKEHEELDEHLRAAREDAQIEVENALFKRATGYDYIEVTKERKSNGEGGYKMVVTKRVTKHEKADVTAAQYWLEHRAPNRWPKTVVAGVNTENSQAVINGLAQLLGNPVPVRQIGSENE